MPMITCSSHPKARRNFGHSVPDVLNSYEPYFRRTLQALRMETQSNPVRWLGSLLHYVTDSGAPPHAAMDTPGDGVHWKMKNRIKPRGVDESEHRSALKAKFARVLGFGLRGSCPALFV